MYMYMYTCELYKYNMSCNNVYIFEWYSKI